MSRPAAEVLDLPAHVGFPRGPSRYPPEHGALLALDLDVRGLPPALAALVRAGKPARQRAVRRVAVGIVLAANLAAVGYDMSGFDSLGLPVLLAVTTVLALFFAALSLPILTLVARLREQTAYMVPTQAFEPGMATPVRRALAATPFVVWHEGRYIQNIRLPLQVVEHWLDRVGRALDDTRQQVADLVAGDALLGELAGIAQGDDAFEAQLVVQRDSERALARQARLAHLHRALTAARDDLAAEADRRRRPPEDGDTRVTWSLDLQDIVTDAVDACGPPGR